MPEIKPKSDCFAYRVVTNECAECKALDSLYCAEDPNCHFYKKRKTNAEDGGNSDGC